MPPELNIVALHKEMPVSSETVQALENLLQEAKKGHLTGIAYVALHTGAGMSQDVLGRCRGIPILTLGMLQMIQKYVQTLI